VIGGTRRRALAAALVAVAVGVASACSLGFDQDANRCNTMADCKRLFPDLKGCHQLTCDTSVHLCGENAMLCCDSNAQCVDAHGGEQWVCVRDGKCLELKSAECPRVLTADRGVELRDDNLVVLGALCDSENACNGIETAWAEIHAQGGLPPRTPGGPKRPLAIITCDTGSNPDRVGTPLPPMPLAHLVLEVGVPIVLRETSNAVTMPAPYSPLQTLLLGHFGAISGPGVSSLVTYRTSPSELAHVATIAASISDYFEPNLKAAGKPLKVLALIRGDAATAPAGPMLSDTLRFNGARAAENGENFQLLTYPAFGNPFSDGVAITAGLIKAVIAAKPHLVIFEGQAEIYTPLLPGIEEAWTETSYRPRFLIGGSLGKTPLLLGAIANNDDLRKRTFGFTSGQVEEDTPTFLAFPGSFRSAIPAGTPSPIAAEGYDATWLAFYAMALDAQNARSNGLTRSIASFMPLLSEPNRPRVMVGPAGLASGLALLGSDVDLVGASGPLDIDLATGTSDQDVDMWYCTADASGAANGFASTGYHYSAAQKRFVGSVVVK
jgi:hypothetical protein